MVPNLVAVCFAWVPGAQARERRRGGRTFSSDPALAAGVPVALGLLLPRVARKAAKDRSLGGQLLSSVHRRRRPAEELEQERGELLGVVEVAGVPRPADHGVLGQRL